MNWLGKQGGSPLVGRESGPKTPLNFPHLQPAALSHCLQCDWAGGRGAATGQAGRQSGVAGISSTTTCKSPNIPNLPSLHLENRVDTSSLAQFSHDDT